MSLTSTTTTGRTVRASLAVGVGIAVLALVTASCGDADDEGGTAATAGPEQTTTTRPLGGSGIVWPVDESVASDDPIEAVTRFAVDFVGFVDPVVTNFRPGEPAQVEVRPVADGPVTTVYLEQVGQGWAVLGAATGNIAPTVPAPLDQVSSPLQLTGTSTSPEGAVGVRVRDRSAGPPLAESYVTGGSMGQMGPFDDTVEYSAPSTTDGSVTFYGTSTDDAGGVVEATVVSVEFTDS